MNAPLINAYLARALGIETREEIDEIMELKEIADIIVTCRLYFAAKVIDWLSKAAKEINYTYSGWRL